MGLTFTTEMLANKFRPLLRVSTSRSSFLLTPTAPLFKNTTLFRNYAAGVTPATAPPSTPIVESTPATPVKEKPKKKKKHKSSWKYRFAVVGAFFGNLYFILGIYALKVMQSY